jgi:erythromycin esterase-like protein
MALRPAAAGSWEALLHALGAPSAWLDLRGLPPLDERDERAVGVVYHPHAERTAHLFPSRLPERYDHVLYTDRTRALVPLDPWGAVAGEETELPETWPFAL